jgi:hypothetical protein
LYEGELGLGSGTVIAVRGMRIVSMLVRVKSYSQGPISIPNLGGRSGLGKVEQSTVR